MFRNIVQNAVDAARETYPPEIQAPRLEQMQASLGEFSRDKIRDLSKANLREKIANLRTVLEDGFRIAGLEGFIGRKSLMPLSFNRAPRQTAALANYLNQCYGSNFDGSTLSSFMKGSYENFYDRVLRLISDSETCEMIREESDRNFQKLFCSLQVEFPIDNPNIQKLISRIAARFDLDQKRIESEIKSLGDGNVDADRLLEAVENAIRKQLMR